LGSVNAESRRRSRDCAAQHVAEQGMEVDAPFARRRLPWVEDVGRLHHQVRRVWPDLRQSAQTEEGCVAVPACCLHDDVIDSTARAACEFAAAGFESADDARRLERVLTSHRTKCSDFSVVMIEIVISVADDRSGKDEPLLVHPP
jgi:hypothetical protein